MNVLYLSKYLCCTLNRSYSTQCRTPKFGILFDIDGVITRGRNVLPQAVSAFSKLVDKEGNFKVPVVFLTNAGSAFSGVKAKQLSKWLGITVDKEQVVMSHSPLKYFSNFHNKRMLISGQGPITEIARSLGFCNVLTMEELIKVFPHLDAVDHQRREYWPKISDPQFTAVEGVVLFGEPVRWETSLQLIVDALMSDGSFKQFPKMLTHPHIPIIACNMDLQWSSEAAVPRFGHGAFLICLETLYKKITGFPIVYSGIVGKPSEITYQYAYSVALTEARKIGIFEHIEKLYAIGDNIYTDILGANLYDEYIVQCRSGKKKWATSSAEKLESMIDSGLITSETIVNSCCSILVETGVHSSEQDITSCVNHSPHDFISIPDALRTPKHVVKNVLEAVNLIFRLEEFN